MVHTWICHCEPTASYIFHIVKGIGRKKVVENLSHAYTFFAKNRGRIFKNIKIIRYLTNVCGFYYIVSNNKQREIVMITLNASDFPQYMKTQIRYLRWVCAVERIEMLEAIEKYAFRFKVLYVSKHFIIGN